MAATDLAPLLEGNDKFFRTMGQLRAVIFSFLGSAAYFGVIGWKSEIFTWYCGVEMMLNMIIWSEETANLQAKDKAAKEEVEEDDEDDEAEEELEDESENSQE